MVLIVFVCFDSVGCLVLCLFCWFVCLFIEVFACLFVCFFVLFVLFCFVLFCFVLFCFMLCCFVLFCFCFVLFCCFVLFLFLLHLKHIWIFCFFIHTDHHFIKSQGPPVDSTSYHKRHRSYAGCALDLCPTPIMHHVTMDTTHNASCYHVYHLFWCFHQVRSSIIVCLLFKLYFETTNVCRFKILHFVENQGFCDMRVFFLFFCFCKFAQFLYRPIGKQNS